MTKVAVIAKLTAVEGKGDELAAILSETGMSNVSGEAGTEVYALHRDKKNPDVMWFYELYTDRDALGIHGGSDGMKAMGAKMGGLLDGRPELFMLDPVAAKGLSFE